MAMKIVGEFELAKEADSGAEEKLFLKQVYGQLKAKPGVGLKLDIEAKSREEAGGKVKKLAKLARSMGAAYKLMVLKVENVGDTGFEVKATLKPNTHKKHSTGPSSSAGKGGKIKAVNAGAPAQGAATLPPADTIKSLGLTGNKTALQMIKASMENPGLAPMVDAQLSKMGMTKEQYIALLDAELK